MQDELIDSFSLERKKVKDLSYSPVQYARCPLHSLWSNNKWLKQEKDKILQYEDKV